MARFDLAGSTVLSVISWADSDFASLISFDLLIIKSINLLCMYFDLVHRCVHIQRQHGVTVRTGVSVAAVASK